MDEEVLYSFTNPFCSQGRAPCRTTLGFLSSTTTVFEELDMKEGKVSPLRQNANFISYAMVDIRLFLIEP